eukprot:TRINITY_DN386_c0_g4_i3.p1 TRINITY_DN386_c0_g4~~TRINITY_DN386_c0_g4_i3.p1  ORF type:complete len:336 (+),score=14.83 TRINITY_DN386_c0_g4_i3:91-1098(+)
MSVEIEMDASFDFFDGLEALPVISNEIFHTTSSVIRNGLSAGHTDEEPYVWWNKSDENYTPYFRSFYPYTEGRGIHKDTLDGARSRIESLSSNTESGPKKPCGACRERKRRCDSSCVFTGIIPYDEPHEYTALNEMFNIKWVEEELSYYYDQASRAAIVERLLSKDKLIKDFLTRYYPSIFKVGDGGTKRSSTSFQPNEVSSCITLVAKRSKSQPCGACKEKKRECNSSCVFAGAISYEEPQKYRTLKKVFNIKWLEELLRSLIGDQRVQVVNKFFTEADGLIKQLSSLFQKNKTDRSPGRGNHIGPDLLASPPPRAMAPPPQDMWQQNLGPMAI